MYWEKQIGDCCRIHSLNAYFGKPLINLNNFEIYCKEYDKIVNDNNNVISIETKNMDSFWGGQNIIWYIIFKIENNYSFIIPKNKLNFNQNELIKKTSNIFVFNDSHIWLKKKNNKIWYNIDWLNGIQQLNNLNLDWNLWHIVVINKFFLFNEIKINIEIIKKAEIYSYIDKYELYNKYLLKNEEINIFNIFNIFKCIKVNNNDYIKLDILISSFISNFKIHPNNKITYDSIIRLLDLIKNNF